ncbi:MAG: DUF6638 family protein, partial [Bacteroidota bacterium]
FISIGVELLKKHNLYGRGLIEIRTKTLIKRYNAALEMLGIEPTGLKKFSIDGWGWSPEIAIEKENDFYLSHGLANPYSILLSPEQANVSVYLPYHSFDKYIVRHIFESMDDQIHELTMRTAVIVECDQEISSYRSPEDLLGIEFFTLKFTSVDKLSEAKEFQMALERKFYDQEFSWADKELRDQLRRSYRTHGVLANKKFLMPPLSYKEIDNFYTRAFGGVFLLRKIAGLKKSLLIYNEDSEKGSEVSGQTATKHMEYNLSDPKLLEYLLDKNVVGVYGDVIFQQVEDIERIMFLELAELIFRDEPDRDLSSLTKPQIRQRVNKYAQSGELSSIYFDLEGIVNSLKRGQIIKLGKLPRSTFRKLIRPNPELSETDSRLIWRILLKIDPSDFYRLYVYDKEEFFQLYPKWSKAKKEWTVNYIYPRYKSSTEKNKNSSS